MANEKPSSSAPLRKCVLYFRVSTQKQGASGLGLEAQKAAVSCCIEGAQVLGEFVEIDSGKNTSRAALNEALDLCKREGAELVIAKLDRLARDVQFIFELRNSGVKFRACDLPDFNTLTLGIFASFAQYELERIKERTKAALDARRERVGEWRKSNATEEGRRKGVETRQKKAQENPNNLRALALLESLQGRGYTLKNKAELLNKNLYRTSRGNLFTPASVRLLEMKIIKREV